MAAPGQEKRKHKRAEASFSLVYVILEPMSVRLALGADNKDAVAYDLSEGGLAIAASCTVPAGRVLDIRFRLLNTAAALERDRMRNFKLRAETRYMVVMPDRSYRVGVRFLNVSDEDRQFIACCV